MKDIYIVECSGSICNSGGVLYEADSISELSPAAKRRLAELHTEDESLDWEHAAIILEREGLFSA